MLIASASPGSVWVEPNYKVLIDTQIELRDAFNQAANIVARRGGFSEASTMLNRIREKRLTK